MSRTAYPRNKVDPVDEFVYIVLSRRTPDATYRSMFAALKEKLQLS